MWTLYQFPRCPFSRKVRLVLAAKGVPHELRLQHPWDRRDELLALNPLGQTPVLWGDGHNMVLIDSRAICEYLEETIDRASFLTGDARHRAAIRAAAAFFDHSLYTDVTNPLLTERVRKRHRREPPDSTALRQAMRAADRHLTLLDAHFVDHEWLVGKAMTLADVAAFAQISVADELGGIDWTKHPPVQAWYQRLKQRPAFAAFAGEA